MPTPETAVEYLRHRFPTDLANLHENNPSNWGVMSPQQMVEHLTEFFCLSTGAFQIPLAIPEEQVPAYKQFLLSERWFRENTKAPAGVLPDTPPPVRLADLPTAKAACLEARNNYLHHIDTNPVLHPAFGWLYHNEWAILHYKHTIHHLRQFSCSSI
ncbi:MAG: DUF1569 domain-containing protein [Ferruginibacter sp.]